MQIGKVLLSCLVLAISASTIDAKRTKIKYTDYEVQSGDTLFIIARKHHTTTEEVRKSNDLEKNQLIRVGQALKVPTDTYFPKGVILKEPKKGMIDYKVEKGDTLYIIAHKNHTTTKELREANGMPRGALIRVGQSLKVPTNTYFPEKIKKQAIAKAKLNSKEKGIVDYIIEKGDTLFIIARKHHTTTKEVRESNGMETGAMIRVGQSLKVPINTYFPEDDNKKKDTKIAKKKENDNTYVIQGGDTLFSIARKHHLTLKNIMALNDMKVGAIIKVGQKLKISDKVSYVSKTKKKHPTKKYRVKRRDTLAKIAKRHKMSIKTLRKLNKLTRKSRIKKGMLLVVYRAKSKSKNIKYKVKKGDTLWLIAKKHDTTVKKLRALNKLSRRARLHKGMILKVDGKTAKPKKKYIAKKDKKKNTKVAKRTTKSKTKRRANALAVLNGKSNRSSRGSAKIIRTAKRYLGTRYVWGAEGPNKFDCSGFTQYVIRKSKGVRLPRVSRKQAYYGRYVSRRNLRAGDLIFFDTSRRRRGYVNHVGIYIGSNKFIHASSAKHRVVISSLNRPFYKARFKWGRRVN